MIELQRQLAAAQAEIKRLLPLAERTIAQREKWRKLGALARARHGQGEDKGRYYEEHKGEILARNARYKIRSTRRTPIR